MIATHEATLKKQLGDGGGANDNDSENYSIETQVKQRWAALTKAMEKTGNENVIAESDESSGQNRRYGTHRTRKVKHRRS